MLEGLDLNCESFMLLEGFKEGKALCSEGRDEAYVVFPEGFPGEFFSQGVYFCFLVDEGGSQIVNSFFIVVYDLLHFFLTLHLYLSSQ